MSNSVSVWLIIPQTNLHVGNESVGNFSVIDKAIQRDVMTGIPCINSSSLKGAIKEYLTNVPLEEKVNVQSLFGSVKGSEDTQKGSAVFFDANLLFIPKQCEGGKVYELAYCDEVIQAFVDKATALGANCSKESIKSNCKALKGNSESVENFKELCSDDSLPIIARNCLEDGESVNLWYEQVLPSQSVLAAIIMTPNAGDLNVLNGEIVQIGANATIGYGYCLFKKLEKCEPYEQERE